MGTAGKWLVRFFALVGVAAVLGAIGFAATGLSARREPPAAEVALARATRRVLMPAAARRDARLFHTRPLDRPPASGDFAAAGGFRGLPATRGGEGERP